ncbi:DUF2851 family protein [Pareuzebyella sediminis]|uniref:DUF2851 family protein n=1 Tax=Pareuzebyella sediminis TaxID=2607998 RepID=UPI0011EBE390|nr:DUF2851 family protein [Pareuzebyella sediminis]
MREDLLHFIWKYKKLQVADLTTTRNEPLTLIGAGTHNYLSGPDFLNAQVRIGDQLWAGNIEIHLKSSDWYAHHHETDANYNNVILHIVWEDDIAVFHSDNSEIPTLELRNFISEGLLDRYRNLFDQQGVNFINCEKDLVEVDTFLFEKWLERLFFERLENKSNSIDQVLKATKNDWEQVFFCLIMQNFGLKINSEAFQSIARALNFSEVRKLQSSAFALESVFFGMAHLLEDEKIVDDYYLRLRKEYGYLKKKFNWNDETVLKPEFFKLRPYNFPTIRLSQAANLYTRHKMLFVAVIEAKTVEELYSIFDVATSKYWEDHFTFGKQSKKSIKKLTKKFIDLLIINAVVPIKFCYAKFTGQMIAEEISAIVSYIKKEDNAILENYEHLGVKVRTAQDSQALLQLYNQYCRPNKCLECAVGQRLLR